MLCRIIKDFSIPKILPDKHRLLGEVMLHLVQETETPIALGRPRGVRVLPPEQASETVRETERPHILKGSRESYPRTPTENRTLNINKNRLLGGFLLK